MEIGRRAAWIMFFINLLLCVVYAIIGFVSFTQLVDFSNQDITFTLTYKGKTQDTTDETMGQIRGIISTTFLSSLVACVFVLATLLLMLGKLLVWGFGFTYGFVCSFSFCIAIIMLLSGVNMLFWRGFWERMEDDDIWSSSETNTFLTVSVLAIILFIWFLIYLIFLMFAKDALDPKSTSQNRPNASNTTNVEFKPTTSYGAY